MKFQPRGVLAPPPDRDDIAMDQDTLVQFLSEFGWSDEGLEMQKVLNSNKYDAAYVGSLIKTAWDEYVEFAYQESRRKL